VIASWFWLKNVKVLFPALIFETFFFVFGYFLSWRSSTDFSIVFLFLGTTRGVELPVLHSVVDKK
jgi:hypothetical protein